MAIRHFVTLALAATWIATPVASEWSAVVERTRKSVVEVESDHGRCTGFIIHTDRRDRRDNQTDYVLTAAHCDGLNLTADRQPAQVVSRDTKHDLLVVEIEDTERPALKLAKDNPAVSEPVMSFGYGYGFDRPLARWAKISDNQTYIADNGIGGPLLALDAAFVSGQSGGPVVNSAGEVVMIVQLGTPVVGFGRGAEDIRERVGRYFEKPPKP